MKVYVVVFSFWHEGGLLDGEDGHSDGSSCIGIYSTVDNAINWLKSHIEYKESVFDDDYDDLHEKYVEADADLLTGSLMFHVSKHLEGGPTGGEGEDSYDIYEVEVDKIISHDEWTTLF